MKISFRTVAIYYIMLALVLVCPPGAALAVDGVVEINQAKALASGGLPFTTSSNGSCRPAYP